MNNRLEECIKMLGQYCKDAHIEHLRIDIERCYEHVYYYVDEDGEHTNDGDMTI